MPEVVGSKIEAIARMTLDTLEGEILATPTSPLRNLLTDSRMVIQALLDKNRQLMGE